MLGFLASAARADNDADVDTDADNDADADMDVTEDASEGRVERGSSVDSVSTAETMSPRGSPQSDAEEQLAAQAQRAASTAATGAAAAAIVGAISSCSAARDSAAPEEEREPPSETCTKENSYAAAPGSIDRHATTSEAAAATATPALMPQGTAAPNGDSGIPALAVERCSSEKQEDGVLEQKEQPTEAVARPEAVVAEESTAVERVDEVFSSSALPPTAQPPAVALAMDTLAGPSSGGKVATARLPEAKANAEYAAVEVVLHQQPHQQPTAVVPQPLPVAAAAATPAAPSAPPAPPAVDAGSMDRMDTSPCANASSAAADARSPSGPRQKEQQPLSLEWLKIAPPPGGEAHASVETEPPPSASA